MAVPSARYRRSAPLRTRAPILAAVVALHILFGWLLIAGLAQPLIERLPDSVTLIALKPPEMVESKREPTAIADSAEEGEAAPENRRAEPKPIVAPEPTIRPIEPPPITAAPVAGPGNDSDAGAGDRPGEGSGAGGEGNGRGSGNSGLGTGGGGIVSGARKLAGVIRDEDYPRSATRSRAQGNVTAFFDVGPDGRARNCRVRQSSGNAALDATTCRLIEERFRYAPARNARGEAVTERKGWQQNWWLERR